MSLGISVQLNKYALVPRLMKYVYYVSLTVLWGWHNTIFSSSVTSKCLSLNFPNNLPLPFFNVCRLAIDTALHTF